MLEDKEERIKAEAYRRWEREGRPEGQHDRHWQEATDALESGEASDIIESEGTTQALKAPKAKVAKPKAAKAVAEAAKPAVVAAKPKAAKSIAEAAKPAVAVAKPKTPKVVAEAAKPAVAAPKQAKPKKAAAE